MTMNPNSFLRTRREDVGDPRILHILDCIEKDLTAGGEPPGCFLSLLSSRADLLPVEVEEDCEAAAWLLPVPPPDDWSRSYDLLFFFSDRLAQDFGGEFAPLPINTRLLLADRSQAKHLSWERPGFRLYTIVPPHEVRCIHPLLKIFYSEYRNTDAVSLTIRTWADRARVEELVSFAEEDVPMPKTKRPKVDLLCGPWSSVEQALLHTWGDACLLPWAGTGAPLEVQYAMAAGNLVCATGWLAGGVLEPHTGTLLDYDLDIKDGNIFASLDWDQVAAVMRMAVGNGKRELFPAKSAGQARSFENATFSQFLLSTGATADD